MTPPSQTPDGLWEIVLDFLKNPHTYVGIVLGSLGTYMAFFRGWVSTPRQTQMASDVSALTSRIASMERHIKRLEAEVKPLREIKDKLLDERLKD